MSPELQQVLKPFRMQVAIIWGALIASIPIYLIVAATQMQENTNRPTPNPMLLAGFALNAVVLAVASLLVPRYFPRAATIAQAMSGNADPEALARSEGGVVNEALAARIRTLDVAERKVLLLRPLFQLHSIIRWALADGIAVMGFTLVLAGHEVGTMIPFAGLALVLLLVAAPRFDRFVERANEMQRL